MSSYSPDLRIELITTGDQAGTWGTTTNTNLSYVIEQAIAGYVSVAVASANQALTYLNGGSATAALNQSVHANIALTTSTGANFAVYAPPASKQYTIYNASSYIATIYNSSVIGNTTAAGTGVAIPAGKTVTVWSDGTNFVFQNNHLSSLTLATDLAVADGGTGASTAADARTNLGLGTIATQNANAVSITGGSITGITDLAVADGGTGASSFTSGGLLRGNGSSALSVASASDIVTQIGSTAVTNAANVAVTTSATSSAFKVPFADTTASTTGNYGLLQDSGSTFTYNPSTNTLTAVTFSGSLSGTASAATNATNVLVTQSSTSSAFVVPFTNTTVNNTGNYGLLMDQDTNFTYNPSTNTLTAATFSGDLDGTATYATYATNAYATLSNTSSAFKVPFLNTTGSTSGSYGLLQDSTSTFTYNPSTNTLTAGTFSGALSGNATTATTATNATTSTTQAPGTNTTAIATTAFSAAAITAERSAAVTLTNKTVNLTDNTLTGTKAQFNTACSDTDFSFLNDFTGSNQSLGASGYQKLPGGLILQWGSQVCNVNSGVVTFPTAFPTACVSVQVTFDTYDSSVFAPVVQDKTTTGFTQIVYTSYDYISFYWFAVGY